MCAASRGREHKREGKLVSAEQPRKPKVVAYALAPWERDGLKAALHGAKLPIDDVGDEDKAFWRYMSIDDTPVGFGGLEIHGADVLLRSVVTMPPLRGRGFGSAIVAALEAEAVRHGCRAVYLITTEESEFFAKLGYAACERKKVPAAIRASAQFASLCPASAAVMVKRIG
jgi:N-acetylglutamate synthase-like GNAT family acetyltransferase